MIDKAGYRYGVGIILVNNNRQVFFAKRIGMLAWQFPQGGRNTGETHEQALFRELQEEIGLCRFKIITIGSSESIYLFPVPIEYVGQSLRWFLIELDDQLPTLGLDFVQMRWAFPSQAVEEIIDWKRIAYKEGLTILGLLK